ncbi:MAG: GNAT family N-acetyltransferase [Clostridia bacterium]|nr:GNAT family N-acetyltransferase [Clostridia bacterium]
MKKTAFNKRRFNCMLEFFKIEKDTLKFAEWFNKSEIQFCDLSVGTKFLWRAGFSCDYAFFNDTLIIKESCSDYKDAFYFPIGKDVDGALKEIENYVKEKNGELKFCCIDNVHAVNLSERYFKTKVYNDRNWSDYIYDANSFKSFVGKKYSGQRNHINKFKKLYPDAKVRDIEFCDVEKIKNFLCEYESKNQIVSETAIIEDKHLREYVENMFSLNQVGIIVEVNNKIVSFSIGEIVKDTLIVHIEKALTEYEGVYPFTANEFAKSFANEKVKFINREEDCGDQGLRISKLQYHPIEVKEKNFVEVFTLFSDINSPVKIEGEEIEISEIKEEDKERYFLLATDDELNKYYGYDYREDLKNEKPTPQYFYDFVNKLKEKKEEYPLAIKLNGKLIGEITFWNYDYYGSVEIGIRLLKEYQGKGLAQKSFTLAIKYLLEKVKAKKVCSRVFKQNESSIKLMKKTGFNLVSESNTHYFFEILKN